jgi:hypothetical protein
MDGLTHAAWTERCIDRLVQIDPSLSRGEAEALARELFQFERTAAMAPEAAVEFVAHQIARPGLRFERRTAPRD